MRSCGRAGRRWADPSSRLSKSQHYLGGALFIGPLLGHLNRDAPALEVLAHCSDRYFEAGLLSNQLSHGFSGSQGVAQLELIGRLIDQEALKTLALLSTEQPSRPNWTSLQIRGSQGFHTHSFVGSTPATDSQIVYTDLLSNIFGCAAPSLRLFFHIRMACLRFSS